MFWFQSKVLSLSLYWLNSLILHFKKVLNYMISDVPPTLHMVDWFVSKCMSGLLIQCIIKWQVLALYSEETEPSSSVDSDAKWSRSLWLSAVGDDRDSAWGRVDRGYSSVTEMVKCALQTHFIFQDFLQLKSIQSSTHPCVQSINRLPIHPIQPTILPPLIQQAFLEHLVYPSLY